MENGTIKAFFLSIKGANAITAFGMRALERTGVSIPRSGSRGQVAVMMGPQGLLRLRVEALDQEDWRARFDSFFDAWAQRVKHNPPARADAQGLMRHNDLALLTSECVEIAKGYIRRDLWDDELVRKHTEDREAIRFSGVFWQILVRRMREAAPQHLLNLSRERVYRLFGANRTRVDILSDPLRPPPVSQRALVETIANRLEEADVDGVHDDLDRYLQACGRGPERILDLGETDFFDLVAADPSQTDSLGARVDGASTATYPTDLARIVRVGVKPTAHLPELNVVQDLLKRCLDRLGELDPDAYAAVRRYMKNQRPDVEDPLGILFEDGRRQLFWCIYNKIR